VRARCSIEDLALLRGLRLRRVDHRLNKSTTTGEFMPTMTLQIPTTDGQADAFAAFPDDDKRHRAVLVYTDVFGVRPVLEEMARELAEHGYYVLVPNLYYRHGPAPVIELPEHIGEEIRLAVVAQLMPLVEAHTTERVLRDADAYLRFLTTQPEVSAGPDGSAGVLGGSVRSPKPRSCCSTSNTTAPFPPVTLRDTGYAEGLIAAAALMDASGT
jgi:hypothetical protein